jgi:hypothetical protein
LSVLIKQCSSVEQEGWFRLRQQLWSNCPTEEHLSEMSLFCERPERFAQFVAYAEFGQAVGLIEVAVRTEYGNGTDSSPVVRILLDTLSMMQQLGVVPAAPESGSNPDTALQPSVNASSAV